jgi:ABC-type branched-subunit amino acid transport system ATPase component
MNAALSTEGLCKRFGGFVAVDDVSLSLPVGARHALIGPNGAGKTTLINLLSGYLQPSAGRVLLGADDVTHLAQHRRARHGLARTFQVNQLFPNLTVLQSVALAVCERMGRAVRWWASLAAQADVLDETGALLDTLRLADVAHRRTRELAYGKQRLLEIALALALKPSVLLLDEPAAGVPAEERAELLQTIAALPPQVSILFIEHDMDLVFRFAQRIGVLVAGRLLAEGTPAEIAADARVREVYLGTQAHG